ncbi:uncharacterized protein LOC128235427 [Mya arenaria]|uniref:uncharacterized protein LOC128235427 n=1 Tax=Mya arenaria TaxID=6604 RepID=UPI0022E8CAAD|nr:uncharacterized protein LOC128235427 [Mya arenaria]
MAGYFIKLFLIFIIGCTYVESATTPVPRCIGPTLENGIVQCSRKDQILTCNGACNTGYIFYTGAKEVGLTCNYSTGAWKTSDTFPECIPDRCLTHLLPNVSDSAITASSAFSQSKSLYFGADRGRLDSKIERVGSAYYSGGWKADINTLEQYIQVELNSTMLIRGVVTQGRSVLSEDSANEYVTQYRILYSADGYTWQPYSSRQVNDQFLPGNNDTITKVVNILTCPFKARFVRINPLAWHENIALRFDLLGCDPSSYSEYHDSPTPTARPTNLCQPLPPPSNGMMHCEKQVGVLSCVSNCVDKYKFDTDEMIIQKVCNQSTGVWNGGEGLPRCIYNTALEPQPPAHNYTNGCVGLKKECDSAGNGDFQACAGCRFFSTCSEGYLYIRACPEALLFDAVSRLCDYRSRSCPVA